MLALDESIGTLTQSTSSSVSTGHSDPSTIPSIALGRSAAFNQTNQADQPAWTSYLAADTTDGSIAESTVVAGSDIVGQDDVDDSPTPLASLVDGEAPIGLLLSGPQALDRASTESQEQVAELVPLNDSSLALAGTLWSVSAESAPSSDSQDQGAESAGEPSSSQIATCAPNGLPDRPGPIDYTNRRRPSHRGPRWHCVRRSRRVAECRGAAIDRMDGADTSWSLGNVPTGEAHDVAQAVPCDNARRNERRNIQLPSTQSRSKDAEPTRSESDRPIMLGTLPLVSMISASTFIAGWIWRIRKQGLRVGQTSERASNGHSRSST